MMKVNVCIGSACHLRGSYSVINALQELVKDNKLEDQVEICAVFCLGHCTQAVSVQIDGGEIESVSPDNVYEFFDMHILQRLNA
nr:NAD(P)H-dependent oxidoreductase subunit E [Candidatus Soleaferrea massiliensis]